MNQRHDEPLGCPERDLPRHAAQQRGAAALALRAQAPQRAGLEPHVGVHEHQVVAERGVGEPRARVRLAPEACRQRRAAEQPHSRVVRRMASDYRGRRVARVVIEHDDLYAQSASWSTESSAAPMLCSSSRAGISTRDARAAAAVFRGRLQAPQ